MSWDTSDYLKNGGTPGNTISQFEILQVTERGPPCFWLQQYEQLRNLPFVIQPVPGLARNCWYLILPLFLFTAEFRLTLALLSEKQAHISVSSSAITIDEAILGSYFLTGLAADIRDLLYTLNPSFYVFISAMSLFVMILTIDSSLSMTKYPKAKASYKPQSINVGATGTRDNQTSTAPFPLESAQYISISVEWTLLKTTSGEMYVEYTGERDLDFDGGEFQGNSSEA